MSADKSYSVVHFTATDEVGVIHHSWKVTMNVSGCALEFLSLKCLTPYFYNQDELFCFWPSKKPLDKACTGKPPKRNDPSWNIHPIKVMAETGWFN